MPNVGSEAVLPPIETTLPPAPPQAIDIPALATTIKQNMTFTQKVVGFLDAIYWLSPIGKLHNKEKYTLYWDIKTKL